MKNVFDSNRRKFLLAAGVAFVPMGLMSCGGGGSSSSSGGGSSVGSSSSSSVYIPPVTVTPDNMTLGIPIVVDQFGYLPNQTKIAVIRDPQSDNLGTAADGTAIVSFDAADAFTPGTLYEVVNAATNVVVYSGALAVWNGGATDPSSGDKAWHFDFSIVTAAGDYFVRDTQRNVKSYTFKIAADVYAPILKAAVRYFYYQRAGQEKLAAQAGVGWADGASHIGPGQDRNARLYSDKTNAATERDVSGGWYDAGDFNKYTSWAAGYVNGLLMAYLEKPSIWGDDYNIPESGNGIPDIVDEAKWGLDWLTRMQETDGSVLSIVGLSSASPPSAATGPSYYGPATTAATLNTAGALALGAKVLAGFPARASYASALVMRAERAWDWAVANPKVVFQNNDSANGSSGLGAGQQETDDNGRLMAKLIAAVYLYDVTNKSVYRDFVDANYSQANLIKYGNYVSAYDGATQDALLYYTSLSGATTSVAASIKTNYITGANGEWVWGKITTKADPYLAFLKDYVWGSNAAKSNTGLLFTALNVYNLGTAHSAADNLNAASHYLHYLHGVNPLGLCYLTNMSSLGAENSASQIYHTWFADGSAKWDSSKTSTYGPPPGFLPGGPNQSQYDWDSRCPSVSSLCGTKRPNPPYAQPAQKSYKDFNDSWPLNSWSITEVSNGYQAAYIRLLSKFI